MSWLFNNGSKNIDNILPINECISKQLDDLLEDSPSSREKIDILENQLNSSSQSLKHILKISKQYQTIGNNFRDISLLFGQELLKFNFNGLPETSKNQNLSVLAKSIGQTIIDINDYHNMLMVQMGNVFIQPLEQFLNEELSESKTQIKHYRRLRSKYDQSISKFSHIKKTDLEKIPEAEHELMQCRNEYQKSSLEYVDTLGRLSAETKLQVVERACAFLYSEKAFFNQGLNIHSNIDKTLSNLSRQITDTHDVITLQSKVVQEKQQELKKNISKNSPFSQISSSNKLESSNETAGYLFLKHGNKWKREYFEVKNGNIYTQIGSNNETEIIANLLVCTVKHANSKDIARRFCFEVVSPSDKLLFQAETEEILTHWINIIQNAIANALNFNEPTHRKSGIKEDNSMIAPNSFLETLRLNEDNKYCADCGDKGPTWASINLGLLICISCSGIHRQLGTHISRVRSITLDEWDLELKKLLLATGNQLGKKIYEYNLPKDIKVPQPDSIREDKQKWIISKYIDKKYLKPYNNSKISLEEALQQSISDDDIELTLSLIIHGANVNWQDPKHLHFSALHFAVTEGQTTHCDLLLQNGADPNIADESGWTPLHHCAFLNKIDCVILLIRRGAKLSIVDNQNKTPLDIAVVNVQAHCVTLLRLAMHAESESGNALEDESFAIALREFSEEVDEMMKQDTKDSLWTLEEESDDET